ncbi:MAG: helix-turn-helix transcriptional regulator [Planctomycetales bacterium]|nr:helix-turn-helix transcriptional regulator [Planctomycetales bacterium]
MAGRQQHAMGGKSSGDYVRGSIDLVLLSVLQDGPKYGYLIQQRISAASGGSVDIPAGTLYPLLHRLEREGLLAAKTDNETGRQRKWYRLTAAGRRRLQQQAVEWTRYAACIQALLNPVLGEGSDGLATT